MKRCHLLFFVIAMSFVFSRLAIASSTVAQDGPDITALMRAIRDGDKDYVKKLIKEGADLNARNDFGWASLMYAVVRNDRSLVKTLLDKGADVNAADVEGTTPLIIAARYADTNLASLLLGRGANPNAKEKDGTTALMSAASRGRADMVKLLLAKGANINDEDDEDATAVTYASRRGHDKMVGLLKKAGGVGREEGPEANQDQSGPGNKKPKLLHASRPLYTEEARQAGVQGVALLRIQVGSDGLVKQWRLLKGLPYGLNEQAVRAATMLRFRPAMKDGNPVAYWVAIEVEFQLR